MLQKVNLLNECKLLLNVNYLIRQISPISKQAIYLHILLIILIIFEQGTQSFNLCPEREFNAIYEYISQYYLLKHRWQPIHPPKVVNGRDSS